MTADDRDRMERAIDHCLEVREQLDRYGSFKLRILLDLLLLELGRELARLTKERSAADAGLPGERF